jgi:hypothetical protein
MKYFAQILTLVVPLAATAAPLQKEQVGADVKWLLHLDADKLRTTKVGDVLIGEHLAAALTQPKVVLMVGLGFDLDVNRINSITVYGTSYSTDPSATGLLLIKTDLELQKAFDATIENASGSGGETPLGKVEKRTEKDGTPVYSINNQAFFSFPKANLVVVAKSRDLLKKEADILSGKSANLASTKIFSEYPDAPKGFFFVGAAEGFSSDATIPPQAQVLKMADGGRAVLGESADHLFLNIALKAKSAEVVTQMQQTIQGFIALASLTQPDNKDLQQLARAVRVSAEDRVISFNVEFPVDQAIQKMREAQAHMNAKKDAKEEGGESEKGSQKKDQ